MTLTETVNKELFTIGVYGTSETSFFEALRRHGITHFIDVRRRRGMRGMQYAYVNRSRLENKLQGLGIEYRHYINLAPTKETRQVQKAMDTTQQVKKSERTELDPHFVQRYESECLANFDAQAFLSEFPEGARIVLFCVEGHPDACHRSLIARRIEVETGLRWRDITPCYSERSQSEL
ncbi:MAG: DUF488 domain-containing protein [Fimbriimonadales bacterium]